MDKISLRKNVRLKHYDYKQEGYYFVTICTDFRKKMFEPRISSKYTNVVSRPWRDSEVIMKNVVARPWRAGPWPAKFKENSDTVENKILNIEKKFSAEVDFYCIMPEHIHLIIVLKARQGRATTSLSWIVNAFKGWCTREFKERIWQPNYYEHVIRNEKALTKIREYIQNNPEAENLNWNEFENED